MCVRNEPPERVIRHLAPLIEGLVARGVGERFQIYVLSDTDERDIAASEAAFFAALPHAWHGRLPIAYRRREQNTGYKAGNIRDFCERWGKDHELALVLDADSVMTADAVLRLVRVMQADPQLGILQSLVTGLPSTSAFARIFTFGMRLGMRSYTIGSACGRATAAPIGATTPSSASRLHGALPAPTAGGRASHRRPRAQPRSGRSCAHAASGFEVRVLPEEGANFEQNPPTLIEFIRRDLRWCQGNMQYWHFLVMDGLSRSAATSLPSRS
jgi:membrane glycosyltransferase